MKRREIQHFRQGIAGSATTNYIRLFDLIEQWKRADAAVIEVKIKQAGLNNIIYLKHILLQKLCESMVWKKNNLDPQCKLLYELIIIKQLRNRNMTGLALKRWDSLYKHSLDKELATFVQLLLNERWQLSIAGREENSPHNYFDLVDLSQSQSEAYGKLVKMRHLEIKIHALIKKSYFLDEHDAGSIKALSTALDSIPSLVNYYEEEYQMLYYSAKSKVLFLTKNYVEALRKVEKAYQIWKHNSNSNFNNNGRFTIEFIKYYADLLFTNNKPERIPALLSFIKKHKFNDEYYSEQHKVLYFLLENRYYNTIRKYDKVKKLYTQSKKHLDHWLANCPTDWKPVLLIGISISAYVSGKPLAAFSHLYQYERIYAKSFRKDSLSILYLFSVVLAYDLEDFELFQAAYQRAYMHFYRNQEHRHIFVDILKPIQKAFGKPGAEDRIAIFKIVVKKINSSANFKSYKLLFANFDFRAWFASKIHNMDYAKYKIMQATKT